MCKTQIRCALLLNTFVLWFSYPSRVTIPQKLDSYRLTPVQGRCLQESQIWRIQTSSPTSISQSLPIFHHNFRMKLMCSSSPPPYQITYMKLPCLACSYHRSPNAAGMGQSNVLTTTNLSSYDSLEPDRINSPNTPQILTMLSHTHHIWRWPFSQANLQHNLK